MVSVERATCVTSTSPITNDVSEDTHGEAPSLSRCNKAKLSIATTEIIDGNLYIWFGSHREASGLEGGARPSQELVKDGGEVFSSPEAPGVCRPSSRIINAGQFHLSEATVCLFEGLVCICYHDWPLSSVN